MRGHGYHPLGVTSSRPGVTKTAEFLGVPAVFFERLARWLFFGRLILDLVGLLRTNEEGVTLANQNKDNKRAPAATSPSSPSC